MAVFWVLPGVGVLVPNLGEGSGSRPKTESLLGSDISGLVE